jgi:release factor glutamine methyltransferase
MTPAPATADLVARLRAAGCVFAEDEAALLLDAAQGAALEELVDRRVAGEPLEHVLGWVAFAGRRWSVGPGVFVPRRRTELMVRTALGLLPDAVPESHQTVLVDLCCGCGAIGGAVLAALARGSAFLHASDVDPTAVEYARRNLEPLGGLATCGDLFDALPAGLYGRVDLLLCNAPYVPTDAIATMPPEARDHEPPVALDGGSDGLDVVRRVVDGALDRLAPGGSLLFEVGDDQVDTATALVAAAGLGPRVVRDEDEDGAGGIVVVGTAR